MNSLKQIFLAALVGAVAAGCASTSTEGPAQYPELKVLSNAPYVWDDSISEALNVARMAQPAGPGAGMKDFDDGKKANTGKITGGERLLDAGLGLIAMGGFGVLSMESLNAGVNRQLDWKPTLVTLIPKNQDTKPDYRKLRDVVGDKIKSAMQAEYKNLDWFGGYTHKKAFVDSNTEFLFFNVDACKSYFKFVSKDKDSQTKEFFSDNRNRKFIENEPNLDKYCVYGGMIEVAGKVNKGGSEYWIVTFEAATGNAFNSVMEKHYDGYVLVPELYDFDAIDTSLNIVVNNGYAKVFSKGSELLFQKK